MNRDIKFRAWNPKDKLMCTYPEISMNNDYIVNIMSPIESFIFMQFINFKDKNNVDIYEGDIVKVTIYQALNSGIKYSIYEVKYDCANLDYRLYNGNKMFKIQYADEVEVIGNIYENSELMRTNI